MNVTSGVNIDVSGQTVDVSGQTVDVSGQTVDVSGQTVDVSGQTVDVSGQTVDVAGQEVGAKVKASVSIQSSVETVTGVAAPLFGAVLGGQRVLFSVTGKIFVGNAGVTALNGYPVEAGERMEWHTAAALYAVADSSVVEVKILREQF